MNQYGYGGRQNPFDERNSPADGGGYSAPAPRAPPPGAFGQGPRPGAGGASRYNQPAMGRNDYGSSPVEMSSLAQNAGSFGQGDPNAILNECRDIDRGIDEIERNLNQLRMLQERSLNEADTSSSSATSRQLDSLSSETMGLYRSLTDRVRKIKSSPDSRQPKNAPQVGRVDRRLKQAIQSYQQVESTFRKRTQDQMARQFRIVRPDASEAEVRAAVEDASGGAQVFQQALMQSDRRGQARAVLSAVQDRQAELQKIERQMVELAQLFQDMDTLVVQQDVQIVDIDRKAEETVENLDKGNEEIAVAVETARKTRKKKWICLGICVAIVVIIAIVVVVYILVTRGGSGGNKKRSLIDTPAPRAAVEFDGEPPLARLYGHSKIVVPGVDFDPTAPAPASRFPGGGRAVAAGPERRGAADAGPQLAPRRMGVRIGVPWTGDPIGAEVRKRIVLDSNHQPASVQSSASGDSGVVGDGKVGEKLGDDALAAAAALLHH